VKQFDVEEYKAEHFVNHKLNISLYDVITIMKRNEFNVVCGKNDVSRIVTLQGHRILVTTDINHVT